MSRNRLEHRGIRKSKCECGGMYGHVRMCGMHWNEYTRIHGLKIELRTGIQEYVDVRRSAQECVGMHRNA